MGSTLRTPKEMPEQTPDAAPGTGSGKDAKMTGAGAIMACRCPRCRKGKMFLHSIYKIPGFSKMHQNCPHCGQDFRIEPGFYFGASYFSYAFNVALIITFVALYFIFFSEYSEWLLIGIIIGLNVILVPVNYRYSRVMMLHLFGGVERAPEV